MALGTYQDGRWHVAASVNVARADCATNIRRYDQRPASYDAMIRASAARHADREAVVCGDRRVTWAEFDAMIERTACGFIAAGLNPGDRMCVMLDNRLEYLVAVLGGIRAGGIVIPLGTRLGPADVAHIVADATPVLAVTASEWRAKLPDGGSLRRVFLVDESGGEDEFAAVLDSAPAPLPTLARDAVAMIFYTSGTTGKPKGACLTHDNFVHTCLHYFYALAIDVPLRSVLVVPGTHIAGFGPLASVTMASGGTIVMMRQFDTEELLSVIAREKVTYAVMVPSMYQLIVMNSSVGAHDISSWKYGVYGGAIMPPAVIERFSNVAPRLRMINAYGATETCAVCTIIPPERTKEAPASVGLSLECDDIIIVADGRQVEAGASGELWIRGPNVSPGYWNDPEATARSFEDGYWKSGDVGHRDETGLITISDRLKDMINRGGFKVFSAEVENALMAHDGVADCAVVGVPDPVLGEKSCAIITSGSTVPTGDELKRYLAERIADYKIPDFWLITSEPIPRNQNGKVQKASLRETAQRFAESQPRAKSR
ncbi:MAG: class I adenylate-forming enzyme family protein [Xanthobacteraceae bacterium]